jgi:opacity protein-like surface antigen
MSIRKHSLLALLMTCATIAMADETNLCIPAITGTPPTIDGNVVGDAGWSTVPPVKLGQYGGSTSRGTMRFATSGGFLYVGFHITTPMMSFDNTIVLALSPNEDPSAVTDAWRIHVTAFPFADPTAGTALTNQPATAVYWRDASAWNLAGSSPLSNPDWLIDETANPKLRAATQLGTITTPSQWSLEMKVPIAASPNATADAGIFLPTTHPFRLYVNVLNTTGNDVNLVDQDAWPVRQPMCSIENPCVNDHQLIHNTVLAPKWGLASLYARPECADVKLQWNEIGVLAPDGSGTIMGEFKGGTCPNGTGPINAFVARPRNDGAFPAAVTASFSISQFGIPSTSTFIPLSVPSPSASGSINAGSTADLKVDWALTPTQSCQFAPPNDHQCLQVTLTSPDPAVKIGTPLVQRNMRVVPASTFKGQAIISGERPLAGRAATHNFLIAVETDQQDGRRHEADRHASTLNRSSTGDIKEVRRFKSPELAELIPVRANTSFGSWIARGYLYTDETLTIGKTDYRIVENAGDFGYIAVHDAPEADWSFGFTGDGLRRIGNGLYTIKVDQGKKAVVETTITATDAGAPASSSSPYRFFLDLGPNRPGGGFGSFTDGRWSANAGIEKMFRPNLSIEGIAGYHLFNLFNGTSLPVYTPREFLCLHIEQFSANLKYYFGPGPLHWFVNGGGGAYHIDSPGIWKWGINGGMGVLYDVNSRWGVEGVYNYHRISASPDLNFSTLQAGLRIRF